MYTEYLHTIKWSGVWKRFEQPGRPETHLQNLLYSMVGPAQATSTENSYFSRADRFAE